MTRRGNNINLASFSGTDLLDVDGHVFTAGVQYEVTDEMAERLRGIAGCHVVVAEAGSEADVRTEVPEVAPVVPTGPEDAPTPLTVASDSNDNDDTESEEDSK